MSGNINSTSIFSSTLFFAGASVLARIAGFVVQIVLGWVLVKEQYGLFAIALSIAAIFSCMRNGGTDQIIIQMGKEYESLAPRVASFSLIFNVMLCLFFISLSEKMASYFDKPELSILLIILALGYLFATPGPILIAQLSIQKKFKQVAIVNLITVLTKHGLTVLLALLGYGILSLLIPLAMQPLIGAATVYLAVKNWPGFSKARDIKIINILRRSIWVIASNFVFQLSSNVQYFILGMYFNSSIIGIYFFAIQLINSPIALINNTVKGVVFPSLTIILDDVPKYNLAVKKSLIIAYSIGGVIGLSGYIFFPLLTKLVWQGKWNESIVFIEILCLIIPSSILINTIYETLASAGLWVDRFFLLLTSIFVEVLSIWVVINYNDMLLVVMSLLVFRSVFSFLACLFSIRRLCGKVSVMEILLLLIPFLSISVSVLIINYNKFIEYDIEMINILFALGFLYYYILLNRYIMINSKFIKFVRKYV